VAHIKGVPPALDAAFRLEVWRRQEADRRRAELERQHREAEEQRARAARRQELVRKLGDGAGRREMAAVDFHAAATAALAVGGAELLDERKGQRVSAWCATGSTGGASNACATSARCGLWMRHLLDRPRHRRAGRHLLHAGVVARVVREAEQRGKLVVFRHV